MFYQNNFKEPMNILFLIARETWKSQIELLLVWYDSLFNAVTFLK